MSIVKSIEQHRRGRITQRQLEQQVVELKVPSMCETLKEAVAIVQEDHRLTTIVLGQGDHTLEMYKHINTWNDNNYLEIVSAMNIVGDPNVPKEKIVVGGIYFKEGIQGNCLLRNLTIRSLSGIELNKFLKKNFLRMGKYVKKSNKKSNKFRF